MNNYPNTYLENLATNKMTLAEAYAGCSEEIIRLRLVENRKLPYIEALEFQERYLLSLIAKEYMNNNGYKFINKDGNIKWEKHVDKNL